VFGGHTHDVAPKEGKPCAEIYEVLPVLRSGWRDLSTTTRSAQRQRRCVVPVYEPASDGAISLDTMDTHERSIRLQFSGKGAVALASSEADVWQPPHDIGVCQSRQPTLLIASLVDYNMRVNISVHTHRRAAFVPRMMEY